jgi:protein arginine kinase activator
MICQNCHKNQATVTVLELQASSEDGSKSYQEEQLCEICAQSKNLPHAPVQKKSLGDIWKLLQSSGAQKSKENELVCPDCGMTREEFRRKGRVGCANDYELFGKDVEDVLERIHGATKHVGRLPGVSKEDLARMEEVAELRKRLQLAIADEAYENAARIRDELEGLQS